MHASTGPPPTTCTSTQLAISPLHSLRLFAASAVNHLVITAIVTFPRTPPSKLRVLIDCGATACFAHMPTLRRLNAPTHALPVPHSLRLIDNSNTSAGPITRSVQPRITFGLHTAQPFCFVTNLGSYDLVLGLPWLQEFNPSIDWPTGKISFPNRQSTYSPTPQPPTPQQLSFSTHPHLSSPTHRPPTTTQPHTHPQPSSRLHSPSLTHPHPHPP